MTFKKNNSGLLVTKLFHYHNRHFYVLWNDLRIEQMYIGFNKCTDKLKFMFSKKATKFDKIFTVHLTLCSKCQIVGDVNFCGLLGKYEL